MKAIFLSNSPANIKQVYDKKSIARLQAKTELDETIYSKADLLATPTAFASVEIVFSTWGMPSLSEEEIHTLLPRLKCVFYAAGSVQTFARPFLNCGVKVFSAWAANAVPVAEYTVSQIILANKGFFAQARLLKQKDLDGAKKQKTACIGNYGETVGLIGCGMIGSLVAKMLQSYDLDVLVYDPFLAQEKADRLNVKKASLDELFAACRVVSNHLANNAETKGMLQYKHFASMPQYATFINTGRGAQVVEDDLVRALTERPDLTALLDVTYPEPAPLTHPFYTLPNCFLTPHIAGSLGNELARMASYMADEVERYTEPLPCKYEVTAEMLKTMA